MRNQNDKNRNSKYIKDEVTLAHLRGNPDVIKIEENDGSFWVHKKDGTTDLFLKLVNGKCGHPFALVGQGYDGKYYYCCDTGDIAGGCGYKRELTEKEVERLIREPEREANR